MKILVINGTYRPKGTSTELARSFLQGAQAHGADVETVLLCEQKIGYCLNCLQCYGFAGDGVAPCSLKDDMDQLIARVVEADGILFVSPVHNGFVSGLMTVFWERLSWRVGRPGGAFIQSMGIRTRIPDKVRALGSIVSAGGMPERLRSFCDDGTRWLKSNAPLMLHGQWIGDQYAGAELEHLPASEQDWRRIYYLRRLGTRQLRQAHALGAHMAQAIQSGNLKPITMEQMLPPLLRWPMELYFRFSPPYRVAQ
jgi:multimeric flavodoxin WrbA